MRSYGGVERPNKKNKYISSFGRISKSLEQIKDSLGRINESFEQIKDTPGRICKSVERIGYL